MKLLAKVVSVIGVVALFVGASLMDSECLIIPISICFLGLVSIGAGSCIGGLFWEWEDI